MGSSGDFAGKALATFDDAAPFSNRGQRRISREVPVAPKLSPIGRLTHELTTTSTCHSTGDSIESRNIDKESNSIEKETYLHGVMDTSGEDTFSSEKDGLYYTWKIAYDSGAGWLGTKSSPSPRLADGPRQEQHANRFSAHTIIHIFTAIMRNLFRFVLSIALAAAIPFLLALRLIFGGSNEPASLIAYPQDLQRTLRPAAPSRECHPPLRTKGRYIVDAENKRFKLVSVNWYGASDELFVVGGLDVRHREEIAMTIKRLGFNSVRLPYSDELVYKNPLVEPALLTANADLIGFRALDVFAEVVNALTNAGIAVIINNHITSARWCCDANLCDGQWKNDYLGPLCRIRQTEEDWITNLETVMMPHVDNPLVVGVDLRNEVRGITDRLLWNSWATAAENAAERLHLLQPEWLMIVEGVSSANVISGARSRPVELSVPHKLVYSAHVYGWSGWGTLRPYWQRRYSSFAKDMDKHWAFLLDEDIAPVWLGEFGSPDVPGKKDLHYWNNLMRYMEEKDVDFGYWAINPRKPHRNANESYGLLEDDWSTPRYDYRLYDMRRLAKSDHE